MSLVLTKASMSLDGYIADQHDDPDPLFDTGVHATHLNHRLQR